MGMEERLSSAGKFYAGGRVRFYFEACTFVEKSRSTLQQSEDSTGSKKSELKLPSPSLLSPRGFTKRIGLTGSALHTIIDACRRGRALDMGIRICFDRGGYIEAVWSRIAALEVEVALFFRGFFEKAF